MKLLKWVGFSLFGLIVGISLLSCGGGGGGGGGASSQIANFSEYYPLTKKTFHTYQITDPVAGITTLTEAWTSGATYNSQASVRTCSSPLEWNDEVYVGGQTLNYGGTDKTGTIITFNQPFIDGIDNWQSGQMVSTTTSVNIGGVSYPFSSAVTFIGIEPIAVSAGVFPDSMKINFSISINGKVVITGSDWYAWGVGLVKEVQSGGKIWELMAYGTLPSAAPTLLSVTPSAGAVDGGNFITFTGTGFQSGAVVTIGNKLAVSVGVKDSNTITAFIPPGTLGTADVAVVNPDCQVALIEKGLEYKRVWTATSTAGVPEARTGHSAVWTGTEMIVWGGQDGNAIAKNTGSRLDPASNTWKPMNTVGAPPPRWGHTAVWTGTEMIIWGGYSGAFSFQPLNDGARYNPKTDSWSTMTAVNVPSVRFSHTAVWTGTEMIVWGGYSCSACSNPGLVTGGRYNPVTDTWTPIPITNAPSARGEHSAVWTGSKMIVWGGKNDVNLTNTGGIYDPLSDSWVPTSLTGAPASRAGHLAVWTGSRMIIFGGQVSTISTSSGNTGGLYDPASNSWSPTSTIGAPINSFTPISPAVWSGTELIIMSGSGARYNPGTDSWSAIWTSGIPSVGAGDSMVWTGSKMIVWGGLFATVLNTGGIYDPNLDPNLFPDPLPSISIITPNSGPISGGTDIVISGANFRPNAAVIIQGRAATKITVVGTNTIYATTPAGNPGYADVVVTISGIPWWGVTSSAGFTYTPFSFEGWIGGGTNGWQIGTAPSGGKPGNAEFSAPSGIFVDAAGYIFVSDSNNNRIQKWDASGNMIGWIGGGVSGWQTGSAPSAGTGNGQFNGTSKVAVDSNGNIYATDLGNNRIQKWDASGNIIGWIGGGVNGWQTGTAPATGNGNCQFNAPMGVALDNSGNIYVADKENHRVQKLDTNGVCIGWVGGGVNGWQTGTAPASGSADGMFYFPMDVAIDSNGNIYVADTWNWRIQKWDASGNNIGWIGGGVNGWQTGTAPATGSAAFRAFQEVFGVSVDSIGNIYIANSGVHSVYKWSSSGNAVGWIGNGQYGWQTGDVAGTYGSALGYFEFPWDAVVGPDGKLYIADAYNARVQKWKE